MKKYYDIRQVVVITSAIKFLADILGVSFEEVRDRIDAGFPELRELFERCCLKGYSIETIIARKLNDVAKDEGVNVRFIPPQFERRKHA